jgi:hypothetical protein
MKKSISMAGLSLLIPALFACQTSVPNNPITYALNYGTAAQQNLVLAAGSSATLAVTVSSSAGGGVAGLMLSANLNNGYCTLPASSAITDANGNASFSVNAGTGGNLACAVTVSLPSVNASRAAVNFSLNIRPIQRLLTAPVSSLTVAGTTISLAGVSAQMSLTSPNAALGSSNDSFNLRVSGLPALPNTLSYVLWATNAAGVTTGLDVWRNTGNAPLSIGYSATPPSNTGSTSPVVPTDNRANFTQVFVTVETGSVVPATPSSNIALETGSNLFVQDK